MAVWIKERWSLLIVSLALIIGFSLIPLIQNPHQYEGRNANGYASPQASHNSITKTAVVLDDAVITPKANPNPNRQEWRSEEGLVAQTEAVQWSKYTFWLGVIATILSVIGVGIVIWTLKETMKAGEKLAEQNKIALDTARAEYQPYLKFSHEIRFNFLDEVITQTDEFGEPTSMNYFFGDALGRMPVEFYLVLENKGKTPITNGMVRVNATLRDRSGKKPKLTWPEFSVKDKCAPILKYLAPNDSDHIFYPLVFITNPQTWKAWKTNKLSDGGLPLVKKSVRKLDVEIEIWVSFEDQFLEGERRTFYTKYGPFFDKNGKLSRVGYEEVKNTEKDNPNYWEALEATHAAVPEA